MADYEYKTVAGPVLITVKNAAQREKAVEEFGRLINQHAVDGWEFHSTDEFQTENPTGCLGLGQKETVTFKLLVFRRPRPPKTDRYGYE